MNTASSSSKARRRTGTTFASTPALKANEGALLTVLERDPFQNPPPYEKLLGNMAGMYSRRINRQHRLVYEVDTANRIVRIISMWTHYE